MELANSQQRFWVVAFDTQTTTPNTNLGNTKEVVIIDVFRGYVLATTIPDEKAEPLEQTLLEQWISLFGWTNQEVIV